MFIIDLPPNFPPVPINFPPTTQWYACYIQPLPWLLMDGDRAREQMIEEEWLRWQKKREQWYGIQRKMIGQKRKETGTREGETMRQYERNETKRRHISQENVWSCRGSVMSDFRLFAFFQKAHPGLRNWLLRNVTLLVHVQEIARCSSPQRTHWMPVLLCNCLICK